MSSNRARRGAPKAVEGPDQAQHEKRDTSKHREGEGIKEEEADSSRGHRGGQ